MHQVSLRRIFSLLYTALRNNFIKQKFNDLIECTFIVKVPSILHVTGVMLFFTSGKYRNYNLWSCHKMCSALFFLLDNVYIRFGTKIFRQIVVICAPLVADLFLL